jgi:alpha-D-ribose 1-methylphosphonate 5-triphosphate synthase subunit PhnG
MRNRSILSAASDPAVQARLNDAIATADGALVDIAAIGLKLGAATPVVMARRTALGVGKEFVESTVTRETVTLYRGVSSVHPGYGDALKGVAKPRGGNASAVDHVLGNTESKFTSWTSDLSTAESFAANQSGKGVMLSKSFSSGSLTVSPGNAAGFGEAESLIRGTVSGATVTRVPQW